MHSNQFKGVYYPLFYTTEVNDVILGDFEVFAHDWLLCTYDMSTKEERTIINDKAALEALYEQYKDDIWMFYNARYDVYITSSLRVKTVLPTHVYLIIFNSIISM